MDALVGAACRKRHFMKDTQLHNLLVGLADAVRDVPEGKVHQALVDRFVALIAHLESKHLIDRGQWNLGARR